MTSPLDPERVRVYASIMDRISPHLEAGHRIRLSMEGDPCMPYARAEDAPVATVQDVDKMENGVVRFKAVVDGTGEVIYRDTTNLDPRAAWEINPADMDLYRASVYGNDGQKSQASDSSSSHELIATDGNPVFKGMYTDMEHMKGDISDLRNEVDEFRKTMASTIRMIAGDVLRTYRGQQTEFVSRFADRYDEVYASAGEELDRTESPQAKHQTEKWSFQSTTDEHYDPELADLSSQRPEPVHYQGSSAIRESPSLTDED